MVYIVAWDRLELAVGKVPETLQFDWLTDNPEGRAGEIVQEVGRSPEFLVVK